MSLQGLSPSPAGPSGEGGSGPEPPLLCGIGRWRGWIASSPGADAPVGGMFPYFLRCFCDNLAPKMNSSNGAARSRAGLYCIETGRVLYRGKS